MLHTVSDLLSYILPSPKVSSNRIGIGTDMMDGIVEVKSTHLDIGKTFRDRRVVVRPTLLSCLKTANESIPSIILDDKNDFPLPSAKFIQFIQSKENALVLVVKCKFQFMDKKVKELTDHKNANILKEITIRFPDSHSRYRWLKSIIPICEKNYLREVVFDQFSNLGDETFFKDAYTELWARILLDWPHLDSIRMVFTLVKGSLSATLILQTLLRVLRWMEVLMKLQEEHVFTKEHAGVFVRFFIQAVTNHGFRVLLFLFEPVTSFLDDFFKNSNAVLRSELSRESLSSHTEEVRDPAFLLKQFLLYVDHLANNILNIHRLIFQKAHHPLETVAELSLWPQTERCAQEIEWNEKVRCEPLSWTMMNSILRDPPFLPYKLIMKEFNSVISDDSVDRVVQLLQDLPLSYFSMSFDSLKMKTKETHGRHFQNLASFCKFREVWKIFAVNQLSLLLTDEISYRFADATFRQAWGYITNHNPRFMKRMFLLENFESVSDYEENSIEEALHGQIFIRLAQHDERTVKVFKLGGVQLPDMTTTKFQCSETLGGSLTVEQRVFLQVEKVQYLSSRIIQWIESLTQRPVGSQANGEFDAKAFVILWNCCIESFIFRAFLLITKPSVGTLDYFTADHSILETFGTQSQLDPLVRFALFITERVLPLRSKSFLSFLKLFSHPFSIDIFSVETFKLSWNAEIAWMKELEKYYGKDWNGFEMSYSEIKKSLSETQFFTFQLFLCNSRSKSVLQNLKLLERIPHDIIYGSFGFYRFNGEFAINEKNYFNPRFALCADLEMFDDSHFLSLLSMFRLINVWESISPHSNFGESPSMANALISALWATFSTGRKDEDRALVNFFYPMTEFSKSYRGFQDMLPLLISTAVLQEDPVLKTIFKIVNPKILNIIDRNQFSIITTAEKAGLRSFLSLLFIWLLTFIGYSEMDQITDFKAFAEIFVLILEQSIYCFTFRAVVCTLNLEFGVADKISAVKGDDLLRTAKKLIQQFINVSTIEGSKEAQVQSLGYFLHSCGHPVAQKSGQNHYIFREISWSDEISWINKSRVPWNMSVSDFEHFLSSATSLCFKYFICTRRKSGRDDLSELVKYIEYIPQLLIKESFECSTEHLLSNNHTQLAINERSIKGRHFISLFKQPIFQELWNLFFIPRMRPTAFVQKVYFLIWENVIAHDRSCKKMFHLADSRREIAVINFINLLQCKLLLALNKSGNIGIEQLLCDVDQMEILEMKKIVALDGDSILKSSLESVIFRIVQWTQCLCSQSNPDLSESACLLQELTADDAILFVELLDACIQDSLFRVLLFLFLPSTSLVPEFAKYSTQTLVNETHRQKAIKLIRYICETISGREWILHRKSLTILSYPKPDFNGVCEPSWKQEQAWIEELTLKRTPDLRIGWQELQCCLLPGAALSYIILTKIINDKYRSEIIQDLSSDYLTSSFALEKMTRISDDYHFYYLCLLEHRTEPEEFRRKEAVASDGIFSVFVKYQLVNDLFIERILTFACANPNQHLLSAFEILRDLIITTNADDEPILCIDTLSMFSNICQIVIDAIYEAANARTVTGSKLIMCRIIELLLLLENTMDTPKLGNLIHLSKLFYLKVVYKSKFFDVIRELDFNRWFGSQCLSRKKSFTIKHDVDPESFYHGRRLELAIFGYFRICLRNDMSYFKNFIDNISISGRTFFLSIFRRHSNFHKKIVTEILAVYRIPISENLCSFEVNDEDVSYLEPSRKFNSFNLSSALYQGYLLYDNNHFLPAAFEVLAAWNKFALPESFITLTLISAFYLHDLQYMKMRLDSFFNKVLVGVSGESKKEMVLQFMKWFLFVYVQNEVKLQEQFSTQRFKWPVCEEFSGVPFEQLMECADYSSIAAQILARGSDDNTGEKGKTVLSNLFFKYFKNKPRFWTSLFSKCSTIAYFIKYVDREDLPKAYEKFKVYNSDKDLGENEKFLKLIKKVQVKFRKQVVSSETLFKLTTGEDSASQFEQLFHELIEKGKAEKDVDMRLIYHLTAKWMQISRDNITVPLPPRNAQLIALLTCASFAKQLLVKKNTSMGKGVIAQVGTGEGKSLIIAFMAIYCVKVLRKRVHILENNLGLLEKDFNEMAPLFKEFDIYPRGGNSNENEPELTRTTPEALKTKDCRNEFCSFGVTYCLRRNMERYYQDCIMKAAEDLEEVFPFKNTVLIVDEVDDLIVDSDPNQYSVAPDNEESEFVEAIKHLTENGGVPNENFQWDSFVWGLANTAYEISRDLREGIDYVRKDGTIYEIGAGGNLVDAYAYHLECLKPFPKLKTRYYAQSIPYMFSQYECLTGFSGSVGAEEYLWEQFKTWIFKVPPFLDTCRGVNKVPAQLMSDPSRLQSSVMYVMPTRREQLQKVVEIAARTYIKVPVLIIATTTREAYEIQELVLAYIALKHNDNEREIQPGDSPREFVQTFLQYKKDSVVPDRENWKSIVKNATDKCSDRYRITVTDPFGGRGHDFDVHDEMVESNYGLAVIVTSIPASEREWIQWKGRTARKDNSGQYAVVLSKEDETIKNSPHLLENAQHHEDIGTDRYLEKVIDRIIESRKEQENEKLKKMNEDIHIGRLLNQLCDSFYRDFPAMNERNWPNGEEQIELRNILTSDVKNHQDIIETFRKLELSAEMIISEDDDERYNGYDSDKDLEIIKAIEELQLNITEESVNSGNVFRNGSLKSVSYDYHANSADLETVVQNRVKEHILEKYKLSYTEISRFFSTDKEERQRTRRSESDDVRDFASTESAAHDEEEEDDIWDSENFLDFKEFKIDDAYPSCEERIPLKPQDTRGSLKQSTKKKGESARNKQLTESKVDDKCESNFVESMDDLIGFFDNDEEKPHANDPPPALRVKTVSSHERELIPEASEATPISARSGLKMNRNDRTKISEPKRIIRREPSTKKFDCEDVGMSAWSSDSDGAKKMESPRVFLEPKRLVNSLGASDSNESPSVSSSSKHKSKHPYTEKRNDTPVQASAKKGNSTSEKKKMDKRSVESKTESSSSRLSVVPLGADSKDSNRLVENLSSDVPSSAKKAEPKKRQRRELTPKIESAPKHLHPEQENEAKRNDNTLPELHDNNISQTQVASNGSSSQATTGKDIEARARIAKNVNASSLRELRVGDTKKFHVRPHNNLHSQLSHLLAKDKANEIIIELTSVKTNAPLPGIETQGILEFLEKSKIYAVTLWIRIANENLQYDINLYGDCKLKIICQNVVVSDQLIPFKPSLQTVPFPFYTFSHATKGTAINDRPISISIRVIESLAKADHPIFESSQSFDGSQTSEWNFLDLPDGIIQAAFNANGFKKVSLPLINFHKEVQYGKGVVSALHALPSGLNKAEASYVMLMSPADLAAGEWRCILRWNAEPQDLDLYCTMSKEPWKIFWNNQNRGGRNELAKGKIELDIDVRSGKGPETITFTPLAGVNYRFFVRNYSGWSKNREFRRTLQSADQVPLSQSGATLTVMMGNEVKMFRVDEDLVFGEDNLPAITWLVFEIVNGEIREINKIVCEDLQQVQMN